MLDILWKISDVLDLFPNSYFTKAILVLSHYIHINKQMTRVINKVQVNVRNARKPALKYFC